VVIPGNTETVGRPTKNHCKNVKRETGKIEERVN
jgi:hypothetical protein